MDGSDREVIDRRNTRVAGKAYVLHISGEAGRTLCGRAPDRVNCYGTADDVRKYVSDLDMTCRVCAKRWHDSPGPGCPVRSPR
jgi:hypothetical protein